MLTLKNPKWAVAMGSDLCQKSRAHFFSPRAQIQQRREVQAPMSKKYTREGKKKMSLAFDFRQKSDDILEP